jgi:hypothetical protein
MSDTWDNLSATPNPPSNSNQGKAPWHFMMIGAGATLLLLLVWFFVRPTGDFAITGNILFWILSMVAYLVPFMLFVISDMKIRTSSTYYYTNPKTVSGARGFYLGFGLLISTFFAYGAADELSRVLNTVS